MRTQTTLFVVMIFAPTALMADPIEEQITRFELFNECKPMSFVVEQLSDGAGKIELTQESLETLVESRLRAARLFLEESPGVFLYLNVTVYGPAFSYVLEYQRRLTDLKNNSAGMATTWSAGATGTHGDNAGYIRQGISEKLDRFILEYLRANEESC